ncbi:uncharacterized protein LOC124619566 isoform X3 [Schistocerca americana]|uniref:uncharacterized protein LOC124619566 isoform X3 n=1 Tax=Schistocerca americana TaxID=7009 RepID=UPI001F502ED6|nr:uncharacterized protein LOC124619566 isoform X3 [Schistocerca americana]
MEVHLDPKEVLAHLNEMGYRNITPEQLRDFVRDLKKLIKYDVQHCKCENWHSGLCTTCSSRSATPNERPPLSSVNGTQHQPRGDKLSDDKKPTKTDASCREYTVTAEIKTGYPKSNKLKKPDNVKFEKENKIEIVEYTKPAPSSSFESFFRGILIPKKQEVNFKQAVVKVFEWIHLYSSF